MRRHNIHLPILVLVTLLPTPALAGGHIGVDFDAGAPIHGVDGVATGLGARLGWRFDLGPVWLQPETGGSFVTVTRVKDGYPMYVPRFLWGGRLGLSVSRVVQPSVFGHGGVGWRVNEARGPAADVGVALDLTLVPHFSFGAHLAYNFVGADHTIGPNYAMMMIPSLTREAIAWLSAGVHGGFTF
jgi:hypothetical protein